MVDPRTTAVFVRKDGGAYSPRKVSGIRDDGRYIHLGREDGSGFYRNLRENVVVSQAAQSTTIAATTRIEIGGETWQNVVEAVSFAAPDQMWSRIFYRRKDNSITYADRPADAVLIRHDAAVCPEGESIMAYWRRVVDAMPDENDPLRFPYARMDFVDENSVLGRIFIGESIEHRDWTAPLVFPFSCNGSQRLAVERALRSSVSVIDGPPGTGKTQTILNIIANIVTSKPDATIGVVSSNNALTR